MKVVIIGAGVAGLGIGWRLLQAGCSVTILERAQPGGGASGLRRTTAVRNGLLGTDDDVTQAASWTARREITASRAMWARWLRVNRRK
jgi:glycine/D-amino acid oxidase-like deaminating enzyme